MKQDSTTTEIGGPQWTSPTRLGISLGLHLAKLAMVTGYTEMIRSMIGCSEKMSYESMSASMAEALVKPLRSSVHYQVREREGDGSEIQWAKHQNDVSNGIVMGFLFRPVKWWVHYQPTRISIANAAEATLEPWEHGVPRVCDQIHQTPWVQWRQSIFDGKGI